MNSVLTMRYLWLNYKNMILLISVHTSWKRIRTTFGRMSTLLWAIGRRKDFGDLVDLLAEEAPEAPQLSFKELSI